MHAISPPHSPVALPLSPGAFCPFSCDEHLLSIEELAKKHGTELNYDEPQKSRGISTAEAEKRLKEFGPNAMSPPKGLPEWVKLLLKARARPLALCSLRLSKQRRRRPWK